MKDNNKSCTEWCSTCDTEVEIPTTGRSKCPNCGVGILPCNMCRVVNDSYKTCVDDCPYPRTFRIELPIVLGITVSCPEELIPIIEEELLYRVNEGVLPCHHEFGTINGVDCDYMVVGYDIPERSEYIEEDEEFI